MSINQCYKIILSVFLLSISTLNAQESKKLLSHEKEAIQFVYEGNTEITAKEPNVIKAEKSYRKAISKDPNNSTAKYNLGVSYYATKNFQEAALRNKQAAKLAKTNGEKHFAYHNLGNAYMGMQKPDKAIEAYKNALRNNPTDEETRYNLALAKKMKEQQDKNNDGKNQNKDNKNQKEEGKDKKDQNKDGENKDNKNNKGDKEGENKNDKGENDPKKEDESDKEGDKKDPKDGKGNEENKDPQPPRPVAGKLSPEQVKSLLEAMSNQEKKVQEKMNAQKVRGAKVKSDKDW